MSSNGVATPAAPERMDSGRAASLAHRRAVSAGKGEFVAATERNGATEQSRNGATEHGGNGATEHSRSGATEHSSNGATESSRSGATEHGGNGATQQSRNGAMALRGNGATQQGRNGAMELGRNGATEQGRNGAAHQSRNKATEQHSNGTAQHAFDDSPQPRAPLDFGRAASRAHRRAVSAGKGAFDPATAQSSNGMTQPALGDSPRPGASHDFGRAASLAHRRAVSTGKGVLDSVTEHGRDGATQLVPVLPATAKIAGSGREFARVRRAEISKRGGDAAPSPGGSRRSRPDRSTPASTLIPNVPMDSKNDYAAEASRITGLPTNSRVQPSGVMRDARWSDTAPKVLLSRTNGGNIVSGALVRSTDRVTGDAYGAAITITGESDPVAAGETLRERNSMRPAVQFPSSRAMPDGQEARRFADSRRSNVAAESSEGGLPVTGSALGRSVRVTGDEAGADRRITGDQYLASERGRTAARGDARPDPVTGAKVVLSRTRAGQAVSGCDVEFNPRVTGGSRGREATISGSQYAAGGDLAVHEAAPVAPVTGDVPLHDSAVTGTSRGAQREISGTPYYREPSAPEAVSAEPVASIDQRFSVRSPQRAAHLRAELTAQPGAAEDRITGSFSAGTKNVTGNIEFAFRSRLAAPGDVPARSRISGEGRASGGKVSGAAWTEQENVTGTEGGIAASRNPSRRAGKPQNFAGARYFEKFADREEPKHLVTGMFGYSSDSAAKVTLSGGAQG